MEDDEGGAPTLRDDRPVSSRRSLAAPVIRDSRYVLGQMLGRGGMGEVWLAHDRRIDREVAIKVMNSSTDDPAAVARFLREARVQGRLDHPAIPPVHDLGSDPEAPYFAMKRLMGITLADVLAAQANGDALAREGWPRSLLLARFVDVCFAVELAHQHGVIHRDLKPANIMLGELGETYVLDWGLARADEAVDTSISTGDLGDSGNPVHTLAGALLGTPGYMAPEQMRGQRVDHRADVYSLGCILFEILVHERAMSAPSSLDDAVVAVECHRPSARLAGEREREREPVPPELDDLCARATAVEPEARVGSARELADAVQHFLDGDRDVARRRDLAAAHAAAAMTRLAESGDAARRDAMREAGRAIALDPTNVQAQQLLVRLLLEPPSEIPAEVRAEILQDQIVGTQNVLRLGVYGYTGNLLLVPLCKILGMAGSWPFFVIAALLALQIGACAIGSRRARPLLRSELALMLGIHLILIMVVAVTFGPLLVAPFFVFGALPITLMFPSLRMPKTLFLLHLLAVAIPLTLEVLGVLPASAWTAGGAIVLKPWAVHGDPVVLLGLVLVAMLAQMIVVLIVVTSQRAAQERATERLHVTAWHLRQLID